MDWKRMNWTHVQNTRDERYRVEEWADGWRLYVRMGKRYQEIGIYDNRDAAHAAAEEHAKLSQPKEEPWRDPS